jgi:hypothetical protein
MDLVPNSCGGCGYPFLFSPARVSTGRHPTQIGSSWLTDIADDQLGAQAWSRAATYRGPEGIGQASGNRIGRAALGARAALVRGSGARGARRIVKV